MLYGKWHKFWQLPHEKRMLLIQVAFLLAIHRLRIIILPFRLLKHTYGKSCGNQVFSLIALAHNISYAHHLSVVVQLVARNTPWKANCLVQAMTVRTLLAKHKHPYVMFFGVAKTTDSMSETELYAHAWVTCGGVYVTGGDNIEPFTVVRTFASDCAHL